MLRLFRQISTISAQLPSIYAAAFYPCANNSRKEEGTGAPKMGLDRDRIRRFHYGGML